MDTNPTPTKAFFQAPSGRIHLTRTCSAGAGNRMLRVRLTEHEWALHENRCRCVLRVTWR
jgi:hypothetical protein